MVKVGTVYKSPSGNVDMNRLPLKIAFSLFISAMIDNSTLLSGKQKENQYLKDKERRAKLLQYVLSLEYYLFKSKFANNDEIVCVFKEEDMEFVQEAISSPIFFEFSFRFVQLSRDIEELGGYISKALIVRRIQ